MIEIWTENNKLCREHGYEDGKKQYTEKEIKGKNIGKINETTPQQQAEIEAQALITRKIREGYSDRELIKEPKQVIPSYPLQSELALSKPINEPPSDYVTGNYCAERKYNGVNLLRVTDVKGIPHTYTRGIYEITEIVRNISVIQKFNKISLIPNTILSYEFIHKDKNGKEIPKDLKGITNHCTTAKKASDRYDKLLSEGSFFSIKLFDTIIYNSIDITRTDYISRRAIAEKDFFNKYPEYEPMYFKLFEAKKTIKIAKNNKWEGLVLRNPQGEKSYIEYTTNGKPYRRGAYKLKFQLVDDYFIYETQIGNAGRLKGLVSKFHLGKFDNKWNVIDCGWCGPGKILTAELPDLAKVLGINPSKYEPEIAIPTNYCTIEVKFAAKQPTSNALEHPVFLRTRPDKKSEECLIEDECNYL